MNPTGATSTAPRHRRPLAAASMLAIISGLFASMAGSSCARFRGPAPDNLAQAGPDAHGPSVAGVRAIESAPLGTLTIRKWQLGNGLIIITVPDPAARAVSYVTVFRVGARDEDASAGQTGLAHFFEHLMFSGSGLGDGRGGFDQRLEEVGGSSNAATDHDFTLYVDDLPPLALMRAIELEADRMGRLDLGMKQVATERQVVVEERLATVEDSVDGVLDEMMWQQAFRTHPYRWPIVGRMADIKAITVETALAFHQRHYAPDRAVVVVAGSFAEAKVLEAIRSAYGNLRTTTAAPTAPVAPERAPAAEVRAHIERPVPADRMLVGYPSPALGDPDRAAYDLLSEVLLGGPSSRLYRLLVVERAIASSIEGDVASTRDPGLWSVWVQMTKGHAASEAEGAMQREIERVLSQPVSPPELDAAKNRLQTAFWQELASSRGRAEALGQFEMTTGDFRNLVARGSGYARVTPEEVSRVGRVYLGSGARSVVVARPKPP